jgi:hypothetical protein
MWILCLIFVFVTGQCFGCMVGTLLRAAINPPVNDQRFATHSFGFVVAVMSIISLAWSWHYFAADQQMQIATLTILGIGALMGVVIGYQSSGQMARPF